MKFNIPKTLVFVSALVQFASQVFAAEFNQGGGLTLFDPNGRVVYSTRNIWGSFSGTPGSFELYTPDSTLLGQPWSLHDGVTFGPGIYTFDAPSGDSYTLAVGAGQVGGHILFDWGASKNIDIVFLWDLYFSSRTPAHCVWPEYDPGMYWCLNPVDGDGDGIPGYAILDGPLAGFSFAFPLSVPIPGSIFLFLSGFVPLLTAARSAKKGTNEHQATTMF